MSVLTLLVRRGGNGLALLLAVLVLNFTLIHNAPGDVADTIAGDMGGADAEVMAQIRRDYGLDRPFHEQLLAYVGKLARGDLGYSFFFNQPVTELLLERLPATLLLVLSAQVLAIMLGTVLGVIAARHPNGLLSHGVTIFALLGFSAPVFWTGIMLIILFCSIFPVFPVAGMIDVTVEGGWFVKTLDVLYHLFLPMVTLASIFLALYSRLARASMLDVLGTDYVRTAQAKGLSEFQVVYKHALRNALGPVVTLAGLQFSGIVSGAVLVETVFSWPGLGTLAFQSITARDAPMVLGILFFSSLVVIVANLVTDLVYSLIDPRIRIGHRG
ncbi:MAG: ABC transporter permease [Immundisolibacterales bacterium]|nr:ABC transporter permease [Immundisolibacterales bacterium]